jgi:hypothetical protein
VLACKGISLVKGRHDLSWRLRMCAVGLGVCSSWQHNPAREVVWQCCPCSCLCWQWYVCWNVQKQACRTTHACCRCYRVLYCSS